MTQPEQTVLVGNQENTAVLARESFGGESAVPAVVLRGVHKSFGKQIVLDGVDLTVNCGETLAMLGRSGTGKSVLLKLIIGLQKPDAGSILVQGQEIASLDLQSMIEIRKKWASYFKAQPFMTR